VFPLDDVGCIVGEEVKAELRGHYLVGFTDAFNAPGDADVKLRRLQLTATVAC
jgi:hypothetical protein